MPKRKASPSNNTCSKKTKHGLKQVYTASLKGLRPTNEDRHFVSTSDKLQLYGVFDGHGGSQVSNYLVKAIPKLYQEAQYPLSQTWINKMYSNIQDSLKQRKYSSRTGSTCLVVAKYQDDLQVVNVGDCRAVLCRDTRALQLSRDHKPESPGEHARIVQLDGEIRVRSGYNTEFEHPWRVNGYSLSRAFGDVKATPQMTHLPDMFVYKLHSHDRFLVLACDGLWDVLTNDEVVDFVLTHCYNGCLRRVSTGGDIAQKLAQHAIDSGSTDNVSVIVAFF